VDQPEERQSTTFKILSPTVNDYLQHDNEGGVGLDRVSDRGEFEGYLT